MKLPNILRCFTIQQKQRYFLRHHPGTRFRLIGIFTDIWDYYFIVTLWLCQNSY
jgi:hypothetical protein